MATESTEGTNPRERDGNARKPPPSAPTTETKEPHGLRASQIAHEAHKIIEQLEPLLEGDQRAVLRMVQAALKLDTKPTQQAQQGGTNGNQRRNGNGR